VEDFVGKFEAEQVVVVVVGEVVGKVAATGGDGGGEAEGEREGEEEVEVGCNKGIRIFVEISMLRKRNV
jgi:hypothetical protein